MIHWLCYIIVTGIGSSAIWTYLSSRHRLPLPPGPMPKFWSGNLHQVPASHSWLTYADWSCYYGPIVFFRVFRRKMLVLNSMKAATDLLDQKSNIYSDRPLLYSDRGLIGRKMSVFTISGQHPRFRKYRKLLHSDLGARTTHLYSQILEDEVRTFLHGFAQSPSEFVSHIRRYTGAIVLKFAYGWTVSGNDDRFVALMEESFRIHAEFNKPGHFLPDLYPLLGYLPSWFPGIKFHEQITHYVESMKRIDEVPINWAKEHISFVSRHHVSETDEDAIEHDDTIKWASAALYAGGSDTSAAVLTVFILLMAIHPDVQQRAQSEILQVVGVHRLPVIGDQPRLPYVLAMMKEVLRWAPPAPLGLPHRLTDDDIYEGHHIPKGTVVLANIWKIARDEIMYPGASKFVPERFLSVGDNEPQLDPRRFVFGFGRRVCPGSHFAEASLFIAIASILAVFNISKAHDETGQEIEPEVEFTSSVTSHVKPFSCNILPRITANELEVLITCEVL